MNKRIIPLLAALLLFSGLTLLCGQADGDYFDLGKSAYKSKRYQKAYDYFKQSVRLNPNKAKYQYNLGLAARKLKHYDEALTAFTKARRLDPDMKFTKKHTDFMKKIREMEVKAGGIGDKSPSARKSKPYQDPDTTQAVKAGKKKKKGGLPTWFIILCGAVGLGVLVKVLGRKKGGAADDSGLTTRTPTRGRRGFGRRTYTDDDYHDRDRYDDRGTGYRPRDDYRRDDSRYDQS